MPDRTSPATPGWTTHPPGMRELALVLEATWGDRLRLPRETFGLDGMHLGDVGTVAEDVALEAPFGRLLRFGVAGRNRTRVLLVAPMAGHAAAQLRETVAGLLPHYDVYVTDWRDARDVPLAEGGFGMDDYIDYLMRFGAEVGPGAHVMAICQSCVPTLAAVSLMAEDDQRTQPRSLTMMAGPVDARVNPGSVNRYATGAPLSWFDEQLISIVPDGAAGAGRRVYGGAMQLITSASMDNQRRMASLSSLSALSASLFNPARYWQTMLELGSAMSPPQPVLDLDAGFYLDNLREVFQQASLAQGSLRHRGRPVRPAAISDTVLLTVEGGQDEICGTDQTRAAHALCSGIDDARKRHVVAEGAGHRDVFSGEHWRTHVLPEVLATLKSSDA